ncbi:MAG: 3-dehydroquinate synthase [Vicinamibacterales bacterium]
MTPTRIDVTSERTTYPVLIGPGLSRALLPLLAEHQISRQRLIITSSRIWRLHGPRARPALAPKDAPALMPEGERAKTLTTVAGLYEHCVRRDLDRSATIIALGGGVVGDVAGFVAATYLRGVRLVQIPTTLLAQVDSSVGGKVGVNLPTGKNMVGAFHPPVFVLCDPELLATLPRREFRSGLYEVVKYGVISSRPLFDQVHRHLKGLFSHDTALLTTIVAQCCQIKADVVASDERESGPRRVLNFGHTVGHALEAMTLYRRFRHGEAIGYGMLAAAHISAERGLMTRDDQASLARVIREMGPLPALGDLRSSDAIDAIGHDKKVVNGRLHFVLAHGIGATKIVSDVHTRELRAAMKTLGMKD